MRHDRTDLRTLDGPDTADGTRAILRAWAAWQSPEPREPAPGPLPTRSPGADQRRHRGIRRPAA